MDLEYIARRVESKLKIDSKLRLLLNDKQWVFNGTLRDDPNRRNDIKFPIKQK